MYYTDKKHLYDPLTQESFFKTANIIVDNNASIENSNPTFSQEEEDKHTVSSGTYTQDKKDNNLSYEMDIDQNKKSTESSVSIDINMNTSEEEKLCVEENSQSLVEQTYKEENQKISMNTSEEEGKLCVEEDIQRLVEQTYKEENQKISNNSTTILLNAEQNVKSVFDAVVKKNDNYKDITQEKLPQLSDTKILFDCGAEEQDEKTRLQQDKILLKID